MSEEQKDEVEFNGPGGLRAKIRGTDVTNILQFAGTCLMAYVLWTHTVDTREMNKEFIAAIQLQTKMGAEMTVAQREQNCLISLDQSKREAEYNSTNGFCKRMARGTW